MLYTDVAAITTTTTTTTTATTAAATCWEDTYFRLMYYADYLAQSSYHINCSYLTKLANLMNFGQF